MPRSIFPASQKTFFPDNVNLTRSEPNFFENVHLNLISCTFEQFCWYFSGTMHSEFVIYFSLSHMCTFINEALIICIYGNIGPCNFHKFINAYFWNLFGGHFVRQHVSNRWWHSGNTCSTNTCLGKHTHSDGISFKKPNYVAIFVNHVGKDITYDRSWKTMKDNIK